MNYSIKNEYLTAEFSNRGAEPQSLKSNKTGKEYIWQGNPDFWPNRAPVVFPIVGALKDDTYTYEGKKYTLNKHGFSRASVFECEKNTDTSVSFVLRHSEETLKVYPFKFKFEVAFSLEGNVLHTDYITTNEGDGEMLFQVGAHEGYNCPINPGEAFSDYYLEFEKDEDFISSEKIGAGVLTGEFKQIDHDGRKINLNHTLFEDDALVFKNVNSRKISLKSNKSSQVVEVSFPGTSNVLLWTKVGAPYICIEPWWGIQDSVSSTGDFKEKECMTVLKPGEVSSIRHSIKIIE